LAKIAPKQLATRARPQAAKAAFVDYEQEDETYNTAIEQLKRELQDLLYVQVIPRDILPNFVFGPNDVVVTLGQDGLVANTAKYAANLPIVAVNPDPQRFDGILMPFTPDKARNAVMRTLERKATQKLVTL